MPSPDDKVTIKQIAELTGIKPKMIASWAYQGVLLSCGLILNGREGEIGVRNRKLKGRWVKGFRWGDAQALVASYRPGGRDSLEEMRKKLPKGYMIIHDAATILRVKPAAVRRAVLDNRLPSVKAPMNGVGDRFHVFVLRSAVEAWAIEKSKYVKPILQIAQITTPPTNPLISADNRECLHARLSLWQEKGRVFPEKLGILVDERKCAG